MFAFLQHPAGMLGALFVSLPVHTSGALASHLQPISAAVALAGIRIFREDHGKRDEAPTILWPAVQDWIVVQRKFFVADHFLASPVRYGFRKKCSHLGEFGQHLEFSQKALGHSHFQVLRDPARHFFHRIHFQRDLHLARAREAVDEHRNVAPLRLLEQQRRTSVLHRPVGKLGDLEIRVHFERNSPQLVFLFERGDELAQVAICHKVGQVSDLPDSFREDPRVYYDGKSGRMTNRTAFITGASRGIGRACALALAQGGVRVAVAARNIEQLETLAGEIRSQGYEAFPVSLDLANPESIKEAIAKTAKDFGPIAILVNNAGITKDGLALRMKKEDWDTVIATNLTGAFLAIQQVLHGMMRERWGRIINISSVVGEMGNPGQANYVASKAGLIGLTKSIAQEMGSRNITVNPVAPGFGETDMTQGLTEELKDKMLANIPLKRIGRPEDVAAAVRFLASEEAGYITGHVLDVNGGIYM